jgi:23S rRNA (cytosine1962-C5)-methyltransferase
MKTEQKEKEIKIFISNDWEDYELLDTGESEKFERFGKYTFVRPYEDAIWEKTFSKSEWENIDGKFWNSKTGARNGWKFKKMWMRSKKMSKTYMMYLKKTQSQRQRK